MYSGLNKRIYNFRVVCEENVVTKFFTDYDKAVRPDFGKWRRFIYKNKTIFFH